MDKYTILLILNLPFVVFGLIKALMMYKDSSVQRVGLLIRLLFWGTILFGLLFAENIYNFLFMRNLTDTDPLSLAEVLLTTGVIFSLFLCMRLYAKADTMERKFTELHEKISIENSKN